MAPVPFVESSFPPIRSLRGNVIPASRISAIGQKILSYYPSPNSLDPNALTQNYVAAGNEGRYQYNQPMGRWDHVFSDNDKFYALVGFFHGTVEFIYTMLGQNAAGENSGQLNFDQSWTQQLSDKNQGQFDGSSVAALLLGYPTGSNTRVDTNASLYRTRPYYAGYVQDTWKAKDKLTVNVGIRYDMQIGWKERYNQLNSGFNFNAANPYSDQCDLKLGTPSRYCEVGPFRMAFVRIAFSLSRSPRLRFNSSFTTMSARC